MEAIAYIPRLAILAYKVLKPVIDVFCNPYLSMTERCTRLHLVDLKKMKQFME